MFNFKRSAVYSIRTVFLSFIALAFAASTEAQAPDAGIYDQIKAFQLNGGKADVSNRVVKRDRVTMTLNGTIYFAAPAAGRVTGAVFVGRGSFTADAPANDFEKANLRRYLKSENVT